MENRKVIKFFNDPERTYKVGDKIMVKCKVTGVCYDKNDVPSYVLIKYRDGWDEHGNAYQGVQIFDYSHGLGTLLVYWNYYLVDLLKDFFNKKRRFWNYVYSEVVYDVEKCTDATYMVFEAPKKKIEVDDEIYLEGTISGFYIGNSEKTGYNCGKTFITVDVPFARDSLKIDLKSHLIGDDEYITYSETE